MNCIALPLLTLALSLAVAVSDDRAAEVSPEQAKTITEIQLLGGGVTVDEKSPDMPVISVNFYHSKVTDAGLENLKGLTKLQDLCLWKSNVTDAGLEYLKGLTSLQRLDLTETNVTDAGLDRLKGLTNWAAPL